LVKKDYFIVSNPDCKWIDDEGDRSKSENSDTIQGNEKAIKNHLLANLPIAVKRYSTTKIKVFRNNTDNTRCETKTNVPTLALVGSHCAVFVQLHPFACCAQLMPNTQ
jgi:hypothetical protein